MNTLSSPAARKYSKALAEELKQELEERNLRCFLAEKDIAAGKGSPHAWALSLVFLNVADLKGIRADSIFGRDTAVRLETRKRHAHELPARH